MAESLYCCCSSTGTLFVSGSLAIPSQSLLTIVALQFVVILPLAAVISTRYFHATGEIHSGAFINGLFVTWLIVAGQADAMPIELMPAGSACQQCLTIGSQSSAGPAPGR